MNHSLLCPLRRPPRHTPHTPHTSRARSEPAAAAQRQCRIRSRRSMRAACAAGGAQRGGAAA